MFQPTLKSKVSQKFDPVKSPNNYQPPLFSDSMIHHNVSPLPHRYIIRSYKDLSTSPYGVSSSRRILSPQLLLKRYDQVRDFLEGTLGLTTAQREVVLRLLRYWAYYGKVYPKACSIAHDSSRVVAARYGFIKESPLDCTGQPGCSKATYWRTIKLLKELGLIHVINRFLIRPYAQISNLYRLDKLVLVIARYLAEHGTRFWEKWLEPYLELSGSLFWTGVGTGCTDSSPPST